ncbi:hornerin-like isoform X2 [Athalia rosae]|nr:hornerin-like isoform X2 [Athalia rosae]
MAAAFLCLLLALLQATEIHAVVNKGSASSGPSKDGPSETDANDRISNSYGPPRPNDVYGPPDGPPRFHGPAPAYGPPPPPPPRKPKPHYGPPKPQYGPPKPQYGPPKPQYGPPKQQYGPPIYEGPPPPPTGQKYGPPLKIRNQYGPPKNGHGPPIPISIETYGPPNKEPSLPFHSGSPQDNYGPPPPPPLIQHAQIQIRPVQQEYGAPLEIPSPPPGVPAPPTPPDIKYDGWQPIAGHVGTPPDGGHSGYSLSSSSSSSSSLSSSSSYSSSHSSSSSLDIGGGDGFHSEALVGARYPIGNVPSDSYGTPIHSAEAQDLKSSVQQSSALADSHGLPPPALPTYEEHSNSDGYSGGIAVSGHATSSQLDQYHQHLEQEQQQQLQQPQQQYGIPGLTNEPSVQYGSPDPEPISIIKTVAFELLPANGGHQESSGSSFGSGSSSDSFSINGGGISLPPPPPPSDGYGLPHGSAGGNSLGADFQSLSIGGSSGFGSDSSSSSHGLLSGGDLVLPPPPPSSHHPIDSYGAPPPSSYSPNGPYPSSQGIKNSGSFQSSSSSSFGSSFHKQQHSSGHHRHVHRGHGPSFRHGPPPPPPGAFVPPRNRPPVKFRNQIPPGVISALRQYDVPPQGGHGKPFKTYGAPSVHGGSSGGRHQQTISSSSHQFSSGGRFFGGGSFGSNSAFAAPNVNYGTPLSFTDFNTPAPIVTYGAPNFGADANSFVSNSASSGSGLYSSLGGNALMTTYGTPIVQHQPHHDCTAGLQKTNQVSFGGSSSESSSSGFTNNFASFGHSYDAGNSGVNLNANVGNFYDTPSVNVLTLQNHQQPNGDLKDSYGNPIGVTYGTPDQAVAALTSNDIHISSGSASTSSSASSSSSSGNFNNQFQVNSVSYPSGNYLNDAVSAEALTAALTAQGFGEAKHSESIGVDASRYLQTHEGSEALALAQGLTATGSDGFQIQGSKGIYSLQIQPADGGLGTENSDGSIRHEQVLSNGLLQDILAAIEQPQNGRVEIQGSPQIQNLEEIYGDLAHAASGNVYNGEQREQTHDISLLENVVQQTLNSEAQSANGAAEAEEHNEEKSGIVSEDSDVSASGKDEVALFFNNNYEDSKKEGRSLETSESKSSKGDDRSE